MKPPLGDLNLSSYPPHPTSTYTYEVTIASRVCDGFSCIINIMLDMDLNF